MSAWSTPYMPAITSWTGLRSKQITVALTASVGPSALGRLVAACHGASGAARTAFTSSLSSSSDSRDVGWGRNDPAS